MRPSDPASGRNRAVRRTAIVCFAVFFAMVGAAYAAVPLYRAFCQATGFNGTVRRAAVAPGRILDRTVTVRFDSNVRGLPWEFKPDQVSQTIRIGDTGLAFYRVTNTSNRAVTGRAAYNVTPESAGAYFEKLECFCFSAQTLQPGQTADFPVVYFIDPRFATDSATKGATEVTLSYTFYPAADPKRSDAAPANGVTGLGG